MVCYDRNIFSEFIFWEDEHCNSDDTSNFDFTKFMLSKTHIEPIVGMGDSYLMVLVGMDSEKRVNII